MEQDLLNPDNLVRNPLSSEEGIIQKADPINLDIDDYDLADIIDKRIKDSHDFFAKEYNLFERRKKNEMYLFGRQIKNKEDKKELKIYEARYLDNAIYEIEASIKPVAMSRLPDMIVAPGGEGEESEKTAQDVSKVVDTDIKKRQNRIALGIAFKHLPVYFTGVIKVRWDNLKNDFVFEVVHPDYIEVDHTCQTNDADDMVFVAQTLPITIQECFIRFPDKKDKLKTALREDGVIQDDNGNKELTKKELATQIKIKEVWFTWQKPKEGGQEGDYEEVNGVLWKYKRCILKKMKNPTWDWEGEEKTYTYEAPGDKSTRREVTEDDFRAYMMTGQLPPNITTEKIFRNYFERPRKPYFFFGYDQWRKIPYDETSRIEQNIRNQESIDESGKRIIEKLKARKKHIWSKDGGLQAKHLEQMDLDDPRQDVLIQGDVNKVHGTVEPEQVTPQEFKYLNDARDRMYQVAGANAIRGEIQSDVATSNQIAREADFTRADDLVEDTINAACEWMADWSLQMIKLRYTDYHFRRMVGESGSITRLKIREDMVDDGMEVVMKASGTDKLRIKNQANDMAKLQLIDPLTYYEDIGVSDPKGRAEKLFLFTSNPAEYMAKFVMNLGDNPQEMAETLNGAPGELPVQAEDVETAPQAPSPMDTGAMPTEPPLVPDASPRTL